MALGENWAYFVSYRDADGGVYCRKGLFSSIVVPVSLLSFILVSVTLNSTFQVLLIYMALYSPSISLHVLAHITLPSYQTSNKSGLNNLPPLLTTFLSGPTPSSFPQTALPTISRDLPSLRLALGPSNSFFAADKSACQWSSLPPALEKALQSRLTETGTWKLGEQPAFVSLGAGGAYFMRTVGGGGAWELKGQAEGINTYLTNAPNFADIKVTLSHSTILLGQCPTALLQTSPLP